MKALIVARLLKSRAFMPSPNTENVAFIRGMFIEDRPPLTAVYLDGGDCCFDGTATFNLFKPLWLSDNLANWRGYMLTRAGASTGCLRALLPLPPARRQFIGAFTAATTGRHFLTL